MSGVNTGLGAFLMRRGNRNVEAATRLMQSKSLPEVFLLQAQWIRDFTDDYMKEASRLSKVHSRLLGTPWRLKDIDQVFHAAPSDRPVAPFMSYVTHQTARHRTGASQV
jgi:hypothetical protein